MLFAEFIATSTPDILSEMSDRAVRTHPFPGFCLWWNLYNAKSCISRDLTNSITNVSSSEHHPVAVAPYNKRRGH